MRCTGLINVGAIALLTQAVGDAVNVWLGVNVSVGVSEAVGVAVNVAV